MQKRNFKRTSVDIDSDLYLLSVSAGISFTPFLNRCLAMFFEVPENPTDKMIREKSEYIVLRLKQNYEREVREILKENASQESVNDAAREREDELIKFGHQLMKAPSYPAFEKHLKNPDLVDERIMATITSEVNRMNGKKWSDDELWNYAITWWNKYGKVTMRAES